MSRCHILVQSQDWKQQKNVWILFKVNNKGTRKRHLMSLFLSLNRFHKFFWCLHCWLWTIKLIISLQYHTLKIEAWFCTPKPCPSYLEETHTYSFYLHKLDLEFQCVNKIFGDVSFSEIKCTECSKIQHRVQ